MSTSRAKRVSASNQCKASAFAVRELKKKGVSFDKSVPKQQDVVREMKTSGLVEKEFICSGYKDVLDWYYESNKTKINKQRKEIKTFFKEKKEKTFVARAEPNPVGYISRCKKDEPFNLDPKVFYKSWRWKEIRLIAIDVCGRRCCNCGQSPHPTNDVVIHVDHIKPLRDNPELALDLRNLQVLCGDCNQGKSWFNKNDYRTEEQRNEMFRRQFESVKITDQAIENMHSKFA